MGCGQSKKKQTLQIQQIQKPPEPKRTLKAIQQQKQQQGKQNNEIKEKKQRNIKTYYYIGDVLGEGAFAVVKKGTNRKTGAEVAVKCIDRNGLPEEDEASLRQEVEILRSLDHPNIVKLLDFFEEDKFFYVVLEFLSGGELFEQIAKKSFYNEKEARDVVRTVCLGMKHCHDKGIAHRDLKPQNLLLTSTGDDAIVKIADFGFARKSSSSTKMLQTQCGTAEYMAPEIISGKKYNTAVDMWSIGVITYILLGGYPPFQHQKINKLFLQIQSGKYEFHEKYWSGVSEEAKDLIRGLLCMDPSARLTVDQVLSHPWINRDDSTLLERNLSANLDVLKRYENNRLRAAVRRIIVINQFNKFRKNSVNGEDPMMTPTSPMLPMSPMSPTNAIKEISEDQLLHNSI